jgi:hypothetical protein
MHRSQGTTLHVIRLRKPLFLTYEKFRKEGCCNRQKDTGATGTNTLVTFPHPSENANEIASSIRLSGTQGGIAKAIGQKGRGRG